MTLQGDGRDGAPDAKAKLDLDEAENLAASFRPAWEVEEEAATAPAAPAATTQFQGSTGSPALGPVDPKGATLAFDARPAMPSAEALDSANVIEVAPAVPDFAKTMPLAQPAPAVDPHRTQAASDNRIPQAQVAKPSSVPPAGGVAQADPFRPAPSSMGSKPPPASRAPSVRPAVPARPAPRPASSVSTDELEALMPPKRGKGTMFAVVGVGIAIAMGLFLKFALTDDPPPTKTNVSSSTNGPALGPAKTADIPPPPTPDEMPTAPATPPAKASEPKPVEPAPVVAAGGAAAEPKPAPKAVEPAPRPTPVREPRPTSRPVAAAPAPAPAPKPAPEPPKTAPKAPPGGIVRDNPF